MGGERVERVAGGVVGWVADLANRGGRGGSRW